MNDALWLSCRCEKFRVASGTSWGADESNAQLSASFTLVHNLADNSQPALAEEAADLLHTWGGGGGGSETGGPPNF